MFLRTSFHQTHKKPYSNSTVCGLVEATADTTVIIEAAKYGLRKIYKPDYLYQKVGIMLVDIVPATYHQSDLFISTSNNNISRKDKLMQLIDKINEEQGRDTIFLGAQGIERTWQMRAELKSHCYTTRWKELAQVRL